MTAAGTTIDSPRPETPTVRRRIRDWRPTRPTRPTRPSRPSRPDVLAALGYLTLSVLVLGGQWRAPATGYLVGSHQDQRMWEWFFAVAAKSVFHLDNPMGSLLQNYPDGVNLMGNTAMFGASLPLAPLTELFGASVTYTLVMTLGLATTAFAWYWLFSRYAVDSRAAAAIGGLFCGFAPAMISHANGHPNFVALAALPLILACVISLGRGGGRKVAVALAFLVAWQVALGEEPLLIFAFAAIVFALAYLACDPRKTIDMARTLAGPLALAAAITIALVAVPLWWQFMGPQSYEELTHGGWNNSLESLWQFSPQSLGGLLSPDRALSRSGTEYNSYFGWPLLALATGTAVWLWRVPLARAAAITAVVMCAFSLGSELRVGGHDVGFLLPWHWLGKLPLLEAILETRFTMAAIPVIALLLALATDKVLRRGSRKATGAWAALVLLALVPLAPLPITSEVRAPTPAFFADGSWREFVDAGSVLTVPVPRATYADALTWQQAAGLEYPIAGGYFVGPAGPDDRTGSYGAQDRITAQFLGDVSSSGKRLEVTAARRAQAVADLRYWRADVVVLPQVPNADALRATLTDLLGDPGRQVSDVWVWDVRHIVA